MSALAWSVFHYPTTWFLALPQYEFYISSDLLKFSVKLRSKIDSKSLGINHYPFFVAEVVVIVGYLVSEAVFQILELVFYYEEGAVTIRSTLLLSQVGLGPSTATLAVLSN